MGHYSLGMVEAYQLLQEYVTPDDASRLLHLADSLVFEEVILLHKEGHVLKVSHREGYFNIEYTEKKKDGTEAN